MEDGKTSALKIEENPGVKSMVNGQWSMVKSQWSMVNHCCPGKVLYPQISR
jgi:hypothetical protein